MTTVVISQPMLFPWVGLFEQIWLADVYVHYDDVQFSKGSFTNRIQVKTASGPRWMTVPLRRRPLSGLIADLEADDSTDWRAAHRRLVDAAWQDAPHAEAAREVLDEVYDSEGLTLCSLLERSVDVLGNRLDVRSDTRIERSSQLGIAGHSGDRVLAIVLAMGGDVYVTGHGALRYLDHEAFEAAGVEVRYMDYACTPYPQQHGAFTPYVTGLDLVANTGPSAAGFLHPRTLGWRDFAASHTG